METISKKKLIYIGSGLAAILFYLTRKYWLDPIKHFLGISFAVYASHYRKARRPKRIILIRHGQSQANIDSKLYDTVPDNKIELSSFGINQAQEAGKILKKIIKNEKIKFFVSPLLRTRQTYDEISKEFDQSKVTVFIDPRCREQEWGNYQNHKNLIEIIKIRKEVGKFYYRFTEGESGADVYDRVSNFLESLYREMDSYDREKQENFVIITHGLFMRFFAMRYYKIPIEKFEKMQNLGNCEMWVMERNSRGSYELKSEIKYYD